MRHCPVFIRKIRIIYARQQDEKNLSAMMKCTPPGDKYIVKENTQVIVILTFSCPGGELEMSHMQAKLSRVSTAKLAGGRLRWVLV